MARPGITVIVSSSATVGPPGPQGPQGEQGIQGIQGDGVPITDDAVDGQVVTWNGSESEWDYVESVYLQVQNDEGDTLSAGTPVYAKGISGNNILVGRAYANDSAKMPAIGVLLEETTYGSSGEIITAGLFNKTVSGLTGVNVGDTVFVSNTGTLTTTKPTASTDLLQNIGIVLQTNETNIQKMKVSAIDRTNDIPNLDSGKFFIGGASGQVSPYTLPTSDGGVDQFLGSNNDGTVTFKEITKIGNFEFDTSQQLSNLQNNFVLTYDHSDGTISLEANDTGGVASVLGTTPISVTSGTTPTVSITAATTSSAGSMSSADKIKLDGIETSADVTDNVNVKSSIDAMTDQNLSLQNHRPTDWILIKDDGSAGDLKYVPFSEVSKVRSDGLNADGDYGLGSQIWYHSNTSTTAGRVYYLNSSGSWTIASASAPNTGGTSLLAVAAGSNSGTDGMILNGFVYMNGGVPGNTGLPMYLTTGTAQSGGLPVNTAPSTAGQVIRVIGNKIDANVLFFNPDQHFEIV
jgi:hypothetical protein